MEKWALERLMPAIVAGGVVFFEALATGESSESAFIRAGGVVFATLAATAAGGKAVTTAKRKGKAAS